MPVLSAPFVPTPPPAGPVVSWAGMSGMTWTGFNDDTWDLTDVAGSGVLLAPGVRGMNMPPIDRFTTRSPAVAGSRWRGGRTDEREVFWPLMVFGEDTGSQAWLDYDARFWRTMHPDKVGVWTVTQPNGTSRSLTLRFTGDGGYTDEGDPSCGGWAVYGITLAAEQPYWSSPPLTRSWMASPPVQFFDAAGSPPFHISSGSEFSTATIDNPGDVETFPTWVLTGPITSASIGVNGHVFEYSVAIPEGQTRTIDTRPDHLTVVDQAGVDKFADLGQVEFVSVPPGSSVPLTLGVVGSGTVTMQLTPHWMRAW